LCYSSSFFLSRQTARWMRLGARQTGVKFALLFRLGSASGATNTQGLLLYGFHDHTMQHSPAINWSIVIISYHVESPQTVHRGTSGQF
jgi:hypothetical protein